jgi:hypothetical protein
VVLARLKLFFNTNKVFLLPTALPVHGARRRVLEGKRHPDPRDSSMVVASIFRSMRAGRSWTRIRKMHARRIGPKSRVEAPPLAKASALQFRP